MVRSLADIFREREALGPASGEDFAVVCSYLEVYNEVGRVVGARHVIYLRGRRRAACCGVCAARLGLAGGPPQIPRTVCQSPQPLASSHQVIYDLLLKNSGPLELREDPDQGVCVAGLNRIQARAAACRPCPPRAHSPAKMRARSRRRFAMHTYTRSCLRPAGSCVQVSSPEEIMGLLEEGNKRRKTDSTDANATSSRSHAVRAGRERKHDTFANTGAGRRTGPGHVGLRATCPPQPAGRLRRSKAMSETRPVPSSASCASFAGA